MTAAAPHDSFREIVVDVAFRPMSERLRPVSWLSAEEKAVELQRIQAERARLAAREAEVILGFAADRPEAPEATRFGDELAAVREASKATVDVELISMGGTSPGTKSAVPGLCGYGTPRDRSSRH